MTETEARVYELESLLAEWITAKREAYVDGNRDPRDVSSETANRSFWSRLKYEQAENNLYDEARRIVERIENEKE